MIDSQSLSCNPSNFCISDGYIIKVRSCATEWKHVDSDTFNSEFTPRTNIIVNYSWPKYTQQRLLSLKLEHSPKSFPIWELLSCVGSSSSHPEHWHWRETQDNPLVCSGKATIFLTRACPCAVLGVCVSSSCRPPAARVVVVVDVARFELPS